MVSQILLVVQILSLGHLLSAEHVTCPEHGDIVHIEHAGGLAPADLVADEDAAGRPSLDASELTIGAEHEHCQACADSNRRGLLNRPAHVVVAHALQVRAVRTEATTVHAPIDLIRLSPKNSPPSA